MDIKVNKKIKKYERLLQGFLTEYVAERTDRKDLGYQLILDNVRRHYQVILNGFDNHRFVHKILFHFEIKETGKIWIWANETDIEIGILFRLQGVPITDIVLGFFPPHLRELSEYAVA